MKRDPTPALEKMLRLKSASMMLFWFGVIFESIIIIGFSSQYITKGYFEQLTVFPSTFLLFNIVNFTWLALGHIMHIVSAYFLSKGSRFALIVCGYETIGFLILSPSVLSSPSGLGIRIYFVLIIILIILGRKDLSKLQSENWRPWKNPLIPNRKVTGSLTEQ